MTTLVPESNYVSVGDVPEYKQVNVPATKHGRITIGPQMGEVIEHGQTISKQYMVFCNRHPSMKEMKRTWHTEDSQKIYHYTCPKCFHLINESDVMFLADNPMGKI